MKKLSVISILYNEEECVEPFVTEVVKVLKSIDTIDYEIIFINDGSTDKSLINILNQHKINPKVKLINMSRRFGPMESIMAGVKAAAGDALVNIDIDLQDPPILIPQMVKHWLEDEYDVVYTTRTKRKGETVLKKVIVDTNIILLSTLLLSKNCNFEIFSIKKYMVNQNEIITT